MSESESQPITFPSKKPSLESPEGKLRRAKEHLQALDAQIAIATSMDSYRISFEHQPERSEYVFYVHDLTPADVAWSYIVGDCVQNLRAALDHLAFQLAVLGVGASRMVGMPPLMGPGGRDLTVEEEAATGFVIEANPAKFPDPGKGRLKLLRSGEYTRIRELQPFHAFDPSVWGPLPGSMEVGTSGLPYQAPFHLQALSTLCNIDKHRLVHAVSRRAEWLAKPDPPIPVRVISTSNEALKDDAEVGRWEYVGSDPGLPADMDMNCYFPIGVALGELGDPADHADYDAVSHLAAMAATVELVLEIFRPCIEHGAAPLPLSMLV